MDDIQLIINVVLVILVIVLIIILCVQATRTWNLSGTYDFIVVGAGTSGCIMSYELAKAGYEVLVLEKGGDDSENPLTTNPLNASGLPRYHINEFFSGLGHTKVTPSPERVFPYVGGQTFGGGSTINGMQYVRGGSEFWNNWAAEVGDDRWNSSNVNRAYDDMFLGTNPLIKTRSSSADIKLSQLFTNSCANVIGTTYQPLYNDPNEPEVGNYNDYSLFQNPTTYDRESAYTATLKDNIESKQKDVYTGISTGQTPKITIVSNVSVLKVIFDDGKVPCAKGVSVQKHGHSVVYHAKKKVILSAGFQSSLILEQSGIGNKTKLQHVGVNCIVDNPEVGENSYNHTLFLISGLVPGTPVEPTDPKALYIGGSFFSTTTGEPEKRDHQLICIYTPVTGVGNVFTVIGQPLQPEQKGSVHIQSRDPSHLPDYRVNYFSDSEPNNIDLVQASKMCKAMYDVLVDMGTTITDPDAIELLDGSDETKHKEYVLKHYGQSYHYTSTCRMGDVVDGSGNVIGVKNLVVSDASICRRVPTGNTAAPAMVIGKILSESIIAEYQ